MQIERHLHELERDGLTTLPGVLSGDEIEHFRSLLDELYDAFDPRVDKPMIDISSGAAGDETSERSRAFNWASVLVGKDARFRGLIRRSPVFDVVASVLGPDCILSSMNSLEPLRGQGHQPLHRDEGPVGPEGPVVVNSLWAMDDITPANGATRFVPGTHKTAELTTDDDPRLIRIEASAGDVVVFDAHILHGASLNTTGARRRAVHVYYTRAGRERQTDWAHYLDAASVAALDPAERKMVGL